MRARDAQHQAETERDRAETAEGKAATEAAIATAVNNFLRRDLLRQVHSDAQRDEGFTGDSNLTVKEALHRAAARIGDRFQGQPLVEAAIRTVIGEAYRSLGEDTTAVIHFERVHVLRQSSLGPHHPSREE